MSKCGAAHQENENENGNENDRLLITVMRAAPAAISQVKRPSRRCILTYVVGKMRCPHQRLPLPTDEAWHQENIVSYNVLHNKIN